MTVYLILTAILLLIWSYSRFLFWFSPQQSFWIYLRRNLPKGCSTFVKLIDIAIKLSLVALAVYALHLTVIILRPWLLF
jgi:hypothetical protein